MIRHFRRFLALALASVVLAACGGSGGGSSADTLTADTAADEIAGDAIPHDAAGDDAAADTATPTFQAISGAPNVGNYHLLTDDLELSVTVTDGQLFVLRAKVGCRGDGEAPCVTSQSVPEISCSTAFEKGYVAPLVDNHAVVPVKTDTLELWVTAVDRLEGVYHLTPGKCCEAHVVVALPNVDAVACAGYQTPDCDPYTGGGCPEGAHCVFDQGLPVCVQDGPTAIGGACDSGDAYCAEGNCIGFDGLGFRCYRYCKGAADCQGLACIELSGGSKVCQLPAAAYDEPCDPLKAPCSTAGYGCYRTALATAPICMPPGTAAEGEACDLDTDCKASLLCSLQKCRAVCDVADGDPACADAFATCKSEYGAVGVCVGQ